MIDRKAIKQNVMRLIDGYSQGKTLGDMCGISKAELESIYSIGYTYYRTGRYKDAEKLFRFICIFNYSENKFWYAYGAALQAQSNFERAIEVYGAILMRDSKSARAYFRIAECRLALGLPDAALQALDGLAKAADPMKAADRELLGKAQGMRRRIGEFVTAKRGA